MKRGKLHKYFVPETLLGRWSVGLILIFFLLFLFSNIVVKIQKPMADQTFFSNPILSTSIFLATISAIASFVTGIISIIRKKERSTLVFISTLIGLLVLLFIIGEILVSH